MRSKTYKMKRAIACIAVFSMLAGCAGCTGNNQETDSVSTASATAGETETETESTTVASTTEVEEAQSYKYEEYRNMSVQEIVDSLTLEQKAAQMVQPAVYAIREKDMEENCYGSVLSKMQSVTFDKWQTIVDDLQQAAITSEAGIPYVYGQDDVHGVNYCDGAVIFPHNIGVGASGDAELLYQIGLATADEAKLCHMLWNFAPCVAQSEDPRWGRTYESYGSDLENIKELSAAYTKGLIDGGVIACAKHYFGDGNVEYGTGESSDVERLIDRGDAQLTEEEIAELLSVYQNLVDTGVQTIMVSHSSLNGVKMHENTKYIQYLKDEMGFEGFIVSDWKSVSNTSGSTYKEQLINCVNAGIDMFMEVDTCDEAMQIIIDAVNDGEISEDRVDDAVYRIIKVKKDEGIFDDPFCENVETAQTETGSDEYRALAEKMVEESLVLVKNENDVLPLKEGMKIYITGPAADNQIAQCGGWTIDWNQSYSENITGVTSILEGFEQVAGEMNIEIITDEAEAENADVVIAVVGEQSYAEWNGDTADMDLCGTLGLEGNAETIEEVKALNKPSVMCIVAGRQVLINDYMDTFDSIVMCYLPGSEGQGVANVLCGKSDFTGTLPSPWYSSTDQIGTDACMFDIGYGLKYN